jgi:hypothetical protein
MVGIRLLLLDRAAFPPGSFYWLQARWPSL